MTQLSRNNDFDDTLRAFLAWQSAVTGAPSADEMKRRLVERVGQGRGSQARSGRQLRLVWAVALLALLLALVLGASSFFGQSLLTVPPPSATIKPAPAGQSVAPSAITGTGCDPMDAVAQIAQAHDLTSVASASAAPSAGPANGSIALSMFGPNQSDSTLNLFDPDSARATALMPIESGNGRSVPDGLAWSPDGSTLAFSVANGLPNPAAGSTDNQFTCEDIFAVKLDGLQRFRVTRSGPGQGATQPAWAPDGVRLAYLSYLDQDRPADGTWPPAVRWIHLLDLRSRVDTVLAECDGCDRLHWSPDGRLIAAPDAVAGGLRIVDVASGGVSRELLPPSNGVLDVVSLAWSSDSTRLVVIDSYGIETIHVDRQPVLVDPVVALVNPPGLGAFQFGPQGEVALDATGERVAVVIEGGSTTAEGLYVIPLAAQGNLVRVADMTGHPYQMSWSPDGHQILVGPAAAGGPGGTEFARVADDGRTPRALVGFGIPAGGQAAWQPVWP